MSRRIRASGRGPARKVAEASTAGPCAQCPWRTSNQGKRHPDGWYTKANLRRLWAGLRRGERMTCHPTDPANPVSDKADQAASNVLAMVTNHGVDPGEAWLPLLLGVVGGFEAARLYLENQGDYTHAAMVVHLEAVSLSNWLYTLGARVPPAPEATP